MCKKDYISNPSTCTCGNSKYLKSIIDGSVVMCDEIIVFDVTVQQNTKTSVKKHGAWSD